jgi:GNAT superfamily N-acetyltransferase
MLQRLTYRRAKPDDFEQIAAHGCFRPDDAARRPGYSLWVKRRIEMGTYLGRVAADGDAVVAGVGVVLLDWGPTRANPGGVMARIVNVYTEPGWRRQGIAKRLLEALMHDCEQRGVREFNLGATEDSRSLYQGLGFAPYQAEMRRRVEPE